MTISGKSYPDFSAIFISEKWLVKIKNVCIFIKKNISVKFFYNKL